MGDPCIYNGLSLVGGYEATFPLLGNQMLISVQLTVLIQSPTAMLMLNTEHASWQGIKLELHCILALDPTQELDMGKTVLPA